MNRYLKTFKEFTYEIFDLESDRADYDIIVNDISKNVVFKGTNLWVLIFAIMVASVGLNMNSTAVVIGAMLISPLMGPIIGIGLGVGIYDFDLIKKSVWNLSVAVFISVITSMIYFWLTPLKDAQSELLGRTLPTIWDVVIAFFGGLAGIVAFTRKEKSNVIPGVAIATALMPPLCTAGYGLATGNIYFFFGAFYLFFINSVFIATATILIVRYLKIPFKVWVDEEQKKKMKYSVIFVSVLTLIPSIYLAYDIVGRSIFNRNATNFISEEIDNKQEIILDKLINPKERKIELVIFGEKIDSTELKALKNKLIDYNLSNTELIIRQNDPSLNSTSLESMKTGIIEDMFKKNENNLSKKESEIRELKKELSKYKTIEEISEKVSKELVIQYPEIIECSLNKTLVINSKSETDTTVLVLINTKKRISNSNLNKMKNWLSVRINEKNIKVVTY